MRFLWIDMLWLLLLVPVLVALYLIILRRRQKYALRFSSLSIIKEALGNKPGFRRHVPPILFLIGLTVMVVALARPVATITLPSQEGTIILTFDVSGSMRAEDVKPTRLEAAKTAAREFVEKQPSAVRIGIVSFSEFAAIVQAPTKDHQAIQDAINRLAPQRRTAIGKGILTSLDAIFEKDTAKQENLHGDYLTPSTPEPTIVPVPVGSYTSAVIILLSDGQSNTGPHPLDNIQQAANRGVRVYTVGLGTPDGTVLRTEGFAIRVRLDEETLKNIALQTGGQYSKAESETDLSNIYKNLSTQLVFETEQTELTALVTALAAIFVLVAGILSMLWFHRLA
ncbi:MAG: VWA domain-containing protein [Chloroflexota bacterium]